VQTRDNSPNNPEHNRASTMAGYSIYYDTENKHLAAHQDKLKDNLRNAKHFARNGSAQYFACICHAVDVWVGKFELANDETSLCRQTTVAGD